MSDEREHQLHAKRAIEAVLMAAIEPVAPNVLAQLLEIPVTTVEALGSELMAEYDRDGRGFVLARVAGGFRYQTDPEMAPYVERFVVEGQHARLSPAALETLAIVAYKQPISRNQISSIRGVSVDSTMNTLVDHGYLEEVGRDPGPGNAVLYGTSVAFLERMGLDSLQNLPPLADFVPDANIVEMLEQGLRVTTDPRADPTSDTTRSA